MGRPAQTIPLGGSASSGGRGTAVVSQTQGQISLLALLSCVVSCKRIHLSEPVSSSAEQTSYTPRAQGPRVD